MAAHNPPINPPPPLVIPPLHPIPPPLVPPSVPPPDGNLGTNMEPTWFKVVVMRCTAGLHEGAASVTLDRLQGAWHFLPNEFVESALQASSRLPIQHLVLKRHKLTNLPANLTSPNTFLPHSLTMLDLSFNCFECLPPVVCQLVNLHELFLGNNNVSVLPEELPKLRHLENLHLQYNKLTSLPVCVCGVVSLRTLNLENNQIATVPMEISQLTRLCQLYLRSNELQSLPDSIRELSSLEELHLTSNALKRLPNRLEGLSSLKQLHLAHNKLRFLPLSIVNLQQLQGLTLSGNPLKFPPLCICRDGISALRAYMQEKYRRSSSVWTSPDGTEELIVSENLYYDSDGSDSDTPYEDPEDSTS